MTIISNSFAPACRQLLPKYTISTLRSIDIVDNQKDYGCILKFFSFTICKYQKTSEKRGVKREQNHIFYGFR